MSVVEEKSTYTSPSDLVAKIRSFLLAQGWTSNIWESGADAFLNISKGGACFNLKAVASGGSNPLSYQGISWDRSMYSSILLVGSDGFNASSAFDNQPGGAMTTWGDSRAPVVRMPELATGSATYWFFYGSSPDAFYCVAAVAPDEYRFLAFGELEKYTPFSGGSFYCASMNRFNTPGDGVVYYPPMGVYPGSASTGNAGGVRATYDGFDGWLGAPHEPSTAANATMRTGLGYVSSLLQSSAAWDPASTSESNLAWRVPHYGEMDDNGSNWDPEGLMRRAYNTTNMLNLLLPVNIFGRRLPLGESSYSILGRLPHCYYFNTQQTNHEAVKTYGAQAYKMMAVHSQANGRGEARMPYCGLAFPVTI